MSFSRLPLQLGVVALFAFAGGFAAQLLVKPSAALAQYEMQDQSTGTAITRAQTPAINFFELRDMKNKKGLNSYVVDGQPGQIFYGEDGNMRLQMGTYTAKGERGQPFMGLSDSRGKLRMLFRLAGKNESPVIIMKDTAGRDRLVLGLALNQPEQEPFLGTRDRNGKGVDWFGEYFVRK
jgi:hypothetical protein